MCVVAEQLSATHGAVKMLHTRVRLILDYLRSVQSGKSNFIYMNLHVYIRTCSKMYIKMMWIRGRPLYSVPSILINNHLFVDMRLMFVFKDPNQMTF